MLKFTSPTPTNSEIAKSVNKTEGSIRAHKKQHPEEIENINLKYKNSNYPFIKVEEYINFNNLELYEDDNLKDIEKESNKLTELILNKNIPGTIYKDGNNVSFTYIPPISKEIETIKNIFNENNIKKPISISIGNHKGGANKTTNTTNIAASLAYFGYKVLIVDFDPQGNASGSFGIYENDYEYTIIDLITMSSQPDIKDIIKKSVININLENKFSNDILGKLDILPNNASMSEKVEDLPTMARNLGTIENTLDRVLNYIKDDYDFILIDLPPRTDVILRTAMIASDYFIISLNAQPFARLGMPNILNPIRKYENIYKQEKGKDFVILGGIVGFYEKGVTIQDINYEQMKEDIIECTKETSSLFNTTIPKSTIIQESQQGEGAVLFTSPTNKIVRNFFDLTLEILERIIINKMTIEEGK
jgi:chromosome partitioning protein